MCNRIAHKELLMNLLKLCFVPKGKINRMQFFKAWLVFMISTICLIIIPYLYIMSMINNVNTLQQLEHAQSISKLYPAAMLCILLVTWYIQICLMIKRSRHIGINPWWVLAVVVVVFGSSMLGFKVFSLFSLVASFIFYAAVPPFPK